MLALSDRVVVGIPARIGSTRLAEKMLADIGGLPLILRTWQRVREAGFDRVFVATDDERIASAVRAAGGHVVHTAAAANGTARVAAALGDLAADVVLNVQGDEPLVPAETLHRIAGSLLDSAGDSFEIATGSAALDADEAERPERVKVVVGEQGAALYFSRSAVPYGGPFRVHVGVYAFRPATLRRVVELPPSALEQVERLEQLRWLANGVQVRVVDVEAPAPAVDTQADLDRVRAIFASRRP